MNFKLALLLTLLFISTSNALRKVKCYKLTSNPPKMETERRSHNTAASPDRLDVIKEDRNPSSTSSAGNPTYMASTFTHQSGILASETSEAKSKDSIPAVNPINDVSRRSSIPSPPVPAASQPVRDKLVIPPRQSSTHEPSQLATFANTESNGDANGPRYKNPVIDSNFPDPGVMKAEGKFYIFGTNFFKNVLARRSNDLITWEELPDALPRLPSWVIDTPGEMKHVWAPEAIQLGPGRFALYYTAVHHRKEPHAGGEYGLHCIDVAFSSTPEGPYEPRQSNEPLLCQREEGGAIDPSPFRDKNSDLYLLWKNDGNAKGQTTHLYINRLSDNGESLVGTTKSILTNTDLATAGINTHVIEAPFLHFNDGHYFLFFSYGNFADKSYSIGYTVSTSLNDGFSEAGRIKSMAETQGDMVAPGGQSLVSGPDCKTWMVYHTYKPGDFQTRPVSLAMLNFDGDSVQADLSYGQEQSGPVISNSCQ